MFCTYTELNCKRQFRKFFLEVVKVLEKFSEIVTFFIHSKQATPKLRGIQQQLKVAEHKLIQSADNRWNSVFLHTGEALFAK